jgi:nicotinamide phosphoribosyltransferase
MAHLTSFKGTDTVAGLLYAAEYYDCPMAGFSIPASEHSTMTMWGKDGESRAYANMVDAYGGDGRLYACVSDSWDLYNAVSNLWCGQLLEAVKAKGGTLVIRPDSGDPCTVCLNVLSILEKKLGVAVNSKGYKVLPDYVRVIYGDGINHDSIQTILCEMEKHGWAASNVAFGMGGALVQKHCRDTHKMAFKCCAAEVDGELVPVYKDPATDSGKRSKSGLLDLTLDPRKAFCTVSYSTRKEYEDAISTAEWTALRTVYENGKLLVDESLDTIRDRLWKPTT